MKKSVIFLPFCKIKKTKMKKDNKIRNKWEQVLDFALQHATGKGLQTGIGWLEKAFNEYLKMTDDTPYGMGGQPGSMHNREVLAERIILALGHHIGGRGLLDERQEKKLESSLKKITEQVKMTRGRKV